MANTIYLAFKYLIKAFFLFFFPRVLSGDDESDIRCLFSATEEEKLCLYLSDEFRNRTRTPKEKQTFEYVRSKITRKQCLIADFLFSLDEKKENSDFVR